MKKLLVMLTCVTGGILFAHPIYVREANANGSLKERVIHTVGPAYATGNDFTLSFTLNVPEGSEIPNGSYNIFACTKGETYVVNDFSGIFQNGIWEDCFMGTFHSKDMVHPKNQENTFKFEAGQSYEFTVSYTQADHAFNTKTLVNGKTYELNAGTNWQNVPAAFRIHLGRSNGNPIRGATYSNISFVTVPDVTTHKGTIALPADGSSAKWSTITWTNDVKPTSADDTVTLSWPVAEGDEAVKMVSLEFDQAVTSGAMIFDTKKPLTLTKSADVSVTSYRFLYTLDTSITFGTGYAELPDNFLGRNITLVTPQSLAVKSVAGKTITYTGGTVTVSESKPNFEPIYGGTVNLYGGATYSFNTMPNSATQTELNLGNTVGSPVTTITLNTFSLGSTTATINAGANITTNIFYLADGGDSRPSSLTQTGGDITVNGAYDGQGGTLRLGTWNSPSTYTLTGGTLTAPNTAIVMARGQNNHIFDISGGVATAQGLISWDAVTGSNTLKIRNGGIFNVGEKGIDVRGNQVVWNFSMDGGTLRATANYASNAPLVVGVNGAIIDTATHTVTFNGAVSGEGTLKQRGTGTLVWANASLSQTLEVGAGSTLNITTDALNMRGATQAITLATLGDGEVAGKVQLPNVLTIDLKDRIFEGQGSITLISGVETFDDKIITFTGASVVRDRSVEGALAVMYDDASAPLVWWTSTGVWMNGATDPWTSGVEFSNGKRVTFGPVLGDVAAVTISGTPSPSDVTFDGGSTVYTLTGDVTNKAIIGLYLDVNSGLVNWDAPFDYAGEFTIAAGATFAVNADKGFTFPTSVVNNGTFAIDAVGGWTLPDSVMDTGAGVIEIRSGTVTSNANKKPIGTFKINAGATLVLTAGEDSPDLTTITGAGTLRILQTARYLRGPDALNFNLSNFDGRVEVIKGGTDTIRFTPSSFTYRPSEDTITPDVKPTFSFGDGTQLYQDWQGDAFKHPWGFDTTIIGIGYVESDGGTLSVLRNLFLAPITGRITLAGDATVGNGSTFSAGFVSGVSDSLLPLTLTIGATHKGGTADNHNTFVSGPVATEANPINLLVHHHTTTLTGVGYYDTLGLTAIEGVPEATLVINGATTVKTLALTKGTITLGADGTLTPSGGTSSPIIIDLGSRSDFAEGATILAWSTENQPTATFELKAGSNYLRLESSDTGLTVTKGVDVMFTGIDTDTLVSENAKSYIARMAELKKPQGTTITHVQISRSDTNKAYLLNVIPSFVQGQDAESSILVATLNCSFRVTDLQIVGSGVDATITATATITVSNGTEKYTGVDAGIKGTLKLVSGKTLETISTPVPVKSTEPSTLTVVGTFVEGNPFYKMVVVEAE